MRLLIAAAFIASASPVLAAQDAATSSGQPGHAAHRMAAERLVTLVMPSGMMRQMLGGAFPAMEGMMDLRVGDLGLPTEGSDIDPDLTYGEFMTMQDPDFRERMRITSEVTNRVLGEVLVEIEPELRSVMTDIYAARFTTAELEEAGRFFATDTGRRFAQIAPTIMQDPAFGRIMATMTPRIAAATPRIVEEVAAATAHLPPAPPEPGSVPAQP